MKKYHKSQNIIVRNLPIIAAFLLPVIILVVIYMGRGIYPFGDQMYLRSDMYHQYATFLKEFQSILKNGDSLFYTWNIGLGSDFISTYAYYLASPVNWLVGVLPTTLIPEIMSCFIILKSGLMAALFVFYVQKRFGKRTFIATGFGLFYALSSYMAAYSWNLMWIDDLLLLPLIVLGLERLVKEKKVVMYTVSLAVAVLSNYYIAIMICIFLVMYFIYLMICEWKAPEKGTGSAVQGVLRSICRFAFYSIIAGLMAAVVVVPAFVLLSSTASGNFHFPQRLTVYFNMLEMISHAVMNVEPTVLKGYIPNIYCTVGLFMFIPLYWIGSRINTKQKIGKTILIFIFLLCFGLNIPTYIWHGFHFPNSLSSRQSFIYIFLVLVMAYEAAINIRDYACREIVACFIGGAGAILALQVLYSSEKYTMLLAFLNVGFLLLYMLWAVLAKRKGTASLAIVFLLVAVCIAEAGINTEETGYPTTSRTVYTSDNADIETLVNGISDPGFYRVEKTARRTKNDGAWSNYRSASEFSSTTLAAVSDFYDAFGMQASTNAFSYYGHTPVSIALLGVKYEMSAEDPQDSLMTLRNTSGSLSLYENKYSLSLGFTVNTDIQANTNLKGEHPFIVQNDFLDAACGAEPVFDFGTKTNGAEVMLKAEKNGRQFIYIREKLKEAKVVITRKDKVIMEKTFGSLENPQIIDLGDVEKGDQIMIRSEDKDVKNITVYPSLMSYDRLDKAMQELGKNQYQLTTFSDTYISGTIHADKDCRMFTTIPYVSGWDAWIDGQKVPVHSFYKAFIMLDLTAGDHTVEFRYHPLGAAVGAGISALAILIFVGSLLARRAARPKKTGRPRNIRQIKQENA